MAGGRFLLGALVVLVLGARADSAAPPTRHASKEEIDFFEKKIRPVLVHNCYECHSGEKAKAKAHLLLDTAEGWRQGGDSGAAIVPGHADDSLIIEAIRYEGLEMPPKAQLSEDVVADFVRWIEMGAPDPRVGKAAKPRGKIDLAEAKKYWAFRPPKAVPPPEVNDSRWSTTQIDRLVHARLEAEHLMPVADADRTTLIRRVTFDLTGLPPTPEAVDAFLADTSSDALAKVVDRLLASPQFGERWGRHWLDVVRYAESSGKERNVPFRYAWRYRDYVIDAFNADKPYDRFIVEQIAGDLLPAKNPEEKNKHIIATGLLALGPKGVNTRDSEQFEMDVIDDQIDVVGRAMLGMTIACARCHDHKFDPIPTTDYYALAGIMHSSTTLAGVAPGKKSALDTRLIALADTDKRLVPSAADLAAEQARQREIVRIETQVQNLRRAMRQASKPPKNNNRGKGRGPQVVYPAAKVDPKEAREKIRELEKEIDELESRPSPVGNYAMGVVEAKMPVDCRVLVRGEVKDKGAPVARGVLTVLKTAQSAHVAPRHSGRLELAHWIADRHNPLTARVMANRVWAHLFGQGIVDSVDNFGALGNEPSNPELLDALAIQFMEQGYSVKRLIRSLVLSRAYQLSSDHNAENLTHDPSNRFAWRMERRRLDAEEIRDAMLAASGQLELQRPHGSPALELPNGVIRGGKESQELRKPTTARSVYLPTIRGSLPEVLQVFDGADPSLIVGKRDVTTVPTQALFLMNNPFVLEQAEAMAKRILADKDRTPPVRIALAYQAALGRAPTDAERAAAMHYLNDYRNTVAGLAHKANPQLMAWTSLCQALFESAEFRYVY